VNGKTLHRPAPQKFKTFNTFNIFNTFAIVTPARDYPPLGHRQAPHVPLLSQRTFPTPDPPSPVFDGPGTREAGGGQGVRAWLGYVAFFADFFFGSGNS
jgi:hypothetical protein